MPQSDSSKRFVFPFTKGRSHQNHTPPTDDKEQHTQPPPYNSQTRPTRTIKAEEVPLWTWKTSESQQWLLAVLVFYFEMCEEQAETIAQSFKGIGLTLYYYTTEQWTQLIGHQDHAVGMSALLEARGYKKGVAPKRFRVDRQEGRLKKDYCSSCGNQS